MTTREIEIEAEAIDAFEATLEVLERAVEDGAFREVVNESPSHYALEWSTLLSGARYDFRFEPFEDGGTHGEAQLEFSGVLGPLLTLFRGSGNGPHLEQILGDIKKLAESEGFYQDEPEDEDVEDDELDPADRDKDDTERVSG